MNKIFTSYTIKVVDHVTNRLIMEYYGIIMPNKGDTIEIDKRSFEVRHITHHFESTFSSTYKDYIKVTVTELHYE